MYTLVVVDAQQQFHLPCGTEKRLKQNCKAEVLKAIKKEASIIFVEFDGWGPSYSSLTSLVKSHKNVFHISKNEWDGSDQVVELVNKYKLPVKKLRITGLYTDQCVNATVKGLAKKLSTSKIEVVGKACGALDEWAHIYGLTDMKQFNNVKVLK